MEQTRLSVMQAIAHQQIVQVRYNGEVVRLAPHLLFERHGELFVSALNLDKNWRSDDERRLGQFKLAGLSGAQVLDEKFDALPSYQAAVPRAGDCLILAI